MSYTYTSDAPAMSPVTIVIYIILAILLVVAEWKMYVKAGKPGWAVLIPFYATWVLYQIICGRGKAMFRLLIPFYNIYWAIKSMICLAHAYGKSTGFGVGLIFLPPIFMLILGFDKSTYVGPQQM